MVRRIVDFLRFADAPQPPESILVASGGLRYYLLYWAIIWQGIC